MTKRKKRRIRRLILLLLIPVFAGIFIFSAVKLGGTLIDYSREHKTYREQQSEFLIFDDAPQVTTAGTLAPGETGAVPPPSSGGGTDPVQTGATAPVGPATAPSDTETSAPSGEPNFRINWEALLARNRDVMGWLWIGDTTVSYPILKDNDHNRQYLYTGLDGEYTPFGSVFADYRAEKDLSSRHTLIYGHNGHNVKFGVLMQYRDQSFYEAHPAVWILTPEGPRRYVIYSAYVTDIRGEAYTAAFSGDEDFAAFLAGTAARSEIRTGVTPTAADKVITLSTCTNVYEDQRFVIHAILAD